MASLCWAQHILEQPQPFSVSVLFEPKHRLTGLSSSSPVLTFLDLVSVPCADGWFLPDLWVGGLSTPGQEVSACLLGRLVLPTHLG